VTKTCLSTSGMTPSVIKVLQSCRPIVAELASPAKLADEDNDELIT